MFFRRMLLHKKVLFVFFLSLENLAHCDKSCWKSFDARQHFEVMDKLDEQYAEVKSNYNEMASGNNFDKDMLSILLKTRGIAARDIHAAKGDENLIPAGINLGGYCMMRLPKSLLFFHRMKLRNNTNFRIMSLNSDLGELKMKAHIMLNDLHLFGSYDFTNILNKPSILSYDPTFGQVEILLKNVSYKIEGRYRLMKNRLNVELIISEIDLDDVLMMYRNKGSSQSVSLQRKNIDVFIDRLKVDLDKWLKDYFNDYLMYYDITEDVEFEKYTQKKTIALNQYADEAVHKVLERLNEIKANAIRLPPFEIHTINYAEVSLRDGVLRGLDSIYRRSVATGTRQRNVRKVDAVVGFSNLKLSYRYDAVLKSGLPPVTGVLTLTADDLTAHMALSMTKNPETVDLSFTFLEQAKPESLTIEGPANRMISNFKYILERHILAIMTNTLMHSIQMLGTVDRCIPLLAPYVEAEAKIINSNEDDQNTLEPKNYNNETDSIVNIVAEKQVALPPSENIKEDTPENESIQVSPNSKNDNSDGASPEIQKVPQPAPYLEAEAKIINSNEDDQNTLEPKKHNTETDSTVNIDAEPRVALPPSENIKEDTPENESIQVSPNSKNDNSDGASQEIQKVPQVAPYVEAEAKIINSNEDDQNTLEPKKYNTETDSTVKLTEKRGFRYKRRRFRKHEIKRY